MNPLALVFLALSYICNYVFASEQKLNDILFSGDYNFIDLTYPFDKNTVYWPGTQSFVFTKTNAAYNDNGSWYAANDFAAGEHGGTHIDAPYHFTQSGLHVGDLPLEKLIVSLVIVDMASKVNEDPNFVLYKHHMDFMLNDNMGKPCIVIIKFGWSKYFYDRKKYLGVDESTNTLNFPGVSAEVGEWITTSFKNVVGIGVDVASVDPGSSTDFPVHQIASKAGLYNIENVKLTEPVPDHGCTALVLPMKIARGTGAPLRLIAICPKKIPTTQ